MKNDIVRVDPVIDHSVRKLCTGAYHGHPHGCPNYGKRPTCPPQALLIEDAIDLSRPVYVAYNVFPFGEHVEKMRAKHPKWSKRQLANCLYWQGTARKDLREFVEAELPGPAFRVLYVPEACGVNVTATMERIGIQLEWPPVTAAYQVALVGISKGELK